MKIVDTSFKERLKSMQEVIMTEVYTNEGQEKSL